MIKKILVDNGSGVVKAGNYDEEFPSLCEPTIGGTLEVRNEETGRPTTQLFGTQAFESRLTVPLKYPIKRGIIIDFDLMDSIWDAAVDPLQENNDNHIQVVMTESTTNTQAKRIITANHVFHEVYADSFYLGASPLMAMYGENMSTGLVIDSGDGITECVPIVDGKIIRNAVTSSSFGGSDITTHLMKLYDTVEDTTLDFFEKKNSVQRMKEEMCYITLDINKERTKNEGKEHVYRLPDGKYLNVGEEVFQAPEALFQPRLIGSSSDSIPLLALKAINQVKESDRKEMYTNILLVGGNTLFQGFKERLQFELERLAPNETIKITSAHHGINSAWLGLKVISSIETFSNLTITRDDYQENGDDAMKAKFK
ncbi:actin-2, putative [Entamoeba invadens IP1]|uniref:Actin-2, putative n=1 Tax=Entamoeba invadens IP1 TaxID=370355 RepID=A0A0A1U084_ENTIV|nr:actin-2, putative [Entamoeba invadens IP1]ELP87289.1 actin-2, putative [Entamoeba invadens IP1]|eukprot:XP_004254060.1 actin-2, putative [Entamoeba invadens IP1]